MRTGALHKLNANGVKKASDGMHSDGGGLFLRVRGERRVWLFRYTWNGKKREMGLGQASSVSLSKAREKAAVARQQVSDGLSPIDNREVAAAPEAAPRTSTTFGAAMRRHIQDHSPTWSNPKHRQQWRNTLETYAGPIMDIPVEDIETAHIADLLGPIWLAKPETARRLRGRIEKILGSTIARKERAGPNPAAMKDNLEHILPRQKVTVKHHAAVPVEDAPAAFSRIWAKRQKGQGYAACITMILSACRSGEIRRLQWSDIKSESIVIPAERMKMRRDHSVPLTGALIWFLDTVPRWAESDLVHPGSTGNPISDMTIAKAMKGVGLGDYTPHGWRSTFRDWAGMSGFPRELAEYQLAHLVGDKTERAYARDTLLEQRHPMMDAWADYVMGEINAPV